MEDMDCFDGYHRVKAAKHGKLFGISMGGNPGVVVEWIKRGINIVVLDSDVGYIMKSCKETYRLVKDLFDTELNRD